MYSECNKCIATPFCQKYRLKVTSEKETCDAKVFLDKALELSDIPAEYLTANLYNYKKDDVNSSALNYVSPFIKNIVKEVEGGLNMMLLGKECGSGKTYHAAMLLNHYIYKTCNTRKFNFEDPLALFVAYPELIHEIRYHKDEEKTQKRVVNIMEVPILLLDDVGSGTMSEFAREQTYIIINHRYNHRLSTIITSNYSAKELCSDDVFGSRIMSRITRNCGFFLFKGTDRRKSWR
jgi:DNA replication protein DnaC